MSDGTTSDAVSPRATQSLQRPRVKHIKNASVDLVIPWHPCSHIRIPRSGALERLPANRRIDRANAVRQGGQANMRRMPEGATDRTWFVRPLIERCALPRMDGYSSNDYAVVTGASVALWTSPSVTLSVCHSACGKSGADPARLGAVLRQRKPIGAWYSS